ncbi:ImmA/IrrE family metallo-endopeptidase [Limosilactobacillus agrestis]|uniref:ImmA/IrrE family metallo-endopeptidase n=1 Tax=Limosilactobacillus agrestis TaxID=2759748 RepID=A0A7W3YL91_9LACO|nr:ImmA/IrrE family metallo-endopeptidase [Limosilactobacillus agrestis]MBB1095221.1 ImmA/IrrE family metallo-endopeptidase [Limosilactobacillus agrestis]MCD7129870.1 ImmA/IrrE family metallo-endopeptidase [Limosilactobacillus agrestis]
MNDMEDLIEWLRGVATEHNITVFTESQWPSNWVPQSQIEMRCVWYNPNWFPACERPLTLAHEIGHILSGDGPSNSCNYCSVNEKAESNGDLIAIMLLLKYCRTHDITFETKQQLIEAFKIPTSMVKSVDRATDYTLYSMRKKYSELAATSTGVFI